MNAYSEIYLDDAMDNLGEAFDYSSLRGYSLDEFLDMFIACGLARQFASGFPKYICGMSGTELAIEVIERTGLGSELKEDVAGDYLHNNFGPDYWCGWILAYYQWKTGLDFSVIKEYLPMSEIRKLYPILHEASEERCVDAFNAIYKRRGMPTRLHKYRKISGLSQKELSDKSGVGLRMIQQYEQRAKDINKASAGALHALAKSLNCTMENLLEPEL